MKYIPTLIFLVFTALSFGQEIIEPCKFGQPLIDALQDDYTPDNPLGYGPARDILYSEIDNNGLELSGIYTNFTVTLDPNEDPSVSAFQNGAGLNAEHVYPQSLGAGNEPAKSDLHNIFPSKVNVNASRGSCPFGEIEDADTDSWFYLNMQSNNIPLTEIEKYSEKDEEDCVFEPREEVKGDIARAMFYFYAIYQTNANNANPNFFPLQKERLYQWHMTDPADALEMERDSLIALQQGNNNPFIVDSTLARRAYFEADASYPEGDPNCYDFTTSVLDLNDDGWVTISSNFVEDELIIYAKKSKGSISLFDLQGRFILEQNLEIETRMNVNDLSQGLYILHIQSQSQEKVFRFFKR
jgi:Endonuclease I/Secretion system C-terminal sorting domain